MLKKVGQNIPMVFKGLSTKPAFAAAAPKSFRELIEENIVWEKIRNRPRFSSLMFKKDGYTIEAGDFPEEDRFILRHKGKEIERFDMWPEKWIMLIKNSY